jgi:RND family efflux transporter MFP subunit
MRPLASLVIGILILAAALAATRALINSREEPEVAPPVRAVPLVETLTVKLGPVPVMVASQGVVEPWRETRLSAEVGGRIIAVSPLLEAGADVTEGDLLAEIDPADFRAAVAQAAARVSEARLVLATEEAAAAQARRDWDRLGSGGEPPPLAARLPQLEAARAGLAAAEAAHAKAEADLRRTRVTAPFDGRVRAKQVELGTVVAPGGAVAELFGTGRYKLRLPLGVDDSARVFRPDGAFPEVALESEAGGRRATWIGRIVRHEGEVDRRTRSIFLVAELEPRGATDDGTQVPLLPGLFLKASIAGQTLPRAVALPREALPDNRSVLLVDADSRLRRREVTVAWGDRREVVVTAGLQDGDKVCLTTVEGFVDGVTEVRVAVPTPEAGPAAATTTP